MAEEKAQEETAAVVEEAKVEPVAAPSPPSVDELVGEATTKLPQLVHYLDPLKLVMTVYSLYIGSPEMPVIKVDLPMALLELEVTQGWKKADVLSACESVMEGLADVVEETMTDFEGMTGTTIEASDLKAFSARYTAEREEQAKLVSFANQLLELVRNISGQLSIPNPDSGAQPEEEEKESFLAKAGLAARAMGRKMGKPFIVMPLEGSDSQTTAPSWLTEAVLDSEDRDIQTIKIVDSRLKQSGVDVKLVWDSLERLNLGREQLTALLKRIADKAREQLAQSKQILQNVSVDFQSVVGVIDAIQDLQGVVLQVHDFFSSKEA
jgi:hypothetical protein